MAKKPVGKPGAGAANLRKYWTQLGLTQELEKAKGGRSSEKAFLNMMTQMQKQAEASAGKAPLGMVPVGPGQSRGPAKQMQNVISQMLGSNYMSRNLPSGKQYVPIATQKRGGALLQALMGGLGLQKGGKAVPGSVIGRNILGPGMSRMARKHPIGAGLVGTGVEMVVWAMLSKVLADAQQSRMFGLEKEAMQSQMGMATKENMLAGMQGPMRDEELQMARARFMQAMGGGQYGGLASGEVAIP